MKLDKLYSLRRNFTVIGITGRTGSGCTMVASLLSKSYEYLDKSGLRKFEENIDETLFGRKYSIIKNYISTNNNWVPFDIIKYKNVILLYLFNKYGGNFRRLGKLLLLHFRESKHDDNELAVQNIYSKIIQLHIDNEDIIKEIKSFDNLGKVKDHEQLLLLNEVFFGKKFNKLCSDLFKILESEGYFRRTVLLHHIACNIRQSGDPLIPDSQDISNIYAIADVINRIIKARKLFKKDKPTKIVIDSLRNSLEIMFFKERYSAFYMLATKDVLNNSKDRILKRLPSNIQPEKARLELVDKLIELDETEYKTKDFSKGKFSSPDVENCIQKSDFHLLNLKKQQITSFLDEYNPQYGELNFLTREEQLLKLIALISQPGIITPSSVERSMQIANTAKLNSGCISRNVGAIITDENFYVKSIGWNDVAKGHTPCNLRNVEHLIEDKNINYLERSSHYSDFEKGHVSNHSNYNYMNEKPGNFKEALKDYFETSLNNNKNDLNGKNCSFCFKTVHNHYEGEANQVHTRSLHAEENAMLQITKFGGQGVENGILFTTYPLEQLHLD